MEQLPDPVHPIEYFNLPWERTMQDPELQLADPQRTEEFLDGYDLFSDFWTKQFLVALVIASYDDLIRESGSITTIEEKLATVIFRDWGIHSEQVRYWSCFEEEEEEDEHDGFAVTPLMRSLWKAQEERNRKSS